jgi:hypothetical protein
MGKGGKIGVFIIVTLVLIVVASVMKESGAGPVMSIAGTAIFILYQAMFKKSKPEDIQSKDNDITLKK